jgi:hypothetical protein
MNVNFKDPKNEENFKELGKRWKEQNEKYIESEKEEVSRSKNNKNKSKQLRETKSNDLKTVPTYKYSSNGRGNLYESVIVDGIPLFVSFDPISKKVNTDNSIEVSTRIFVPPELEEYPYAAYEFKSKEEIQSYANRIINEKIDLDKLFQRVYAMISKFNDQEEYKLSIISCDIIFSYFQDRFSTTHYDILVGIPGSGKSSLSDTFGAIAYRPVNMTDPTAANLYRLLGTVESGQCTIILEEAERIDQSQDLMAVLKTGYTLNGRVARVNMNTSKQEFFYSYGLKIMVAERSPSQRIAKGVIDRSFILNCFKGNPENDIKETLNPTQTGGPDHEELLAEIIDLRKISFVYRLIHFRDLFPDLDIGIIGRDKELAKGPLQLFQGSETQEKIIKSLQIVLDLKNQRKETSQESALLSMVSELIDHRGPAMSSKNFWKSLPDYIPGQFYNDDAKSNEFYSEDHGIFYRNTLSTILSDKFGARIKHERNGNILIFDPETISKLRKQYNNKIVINDKNDEGSEGSESIRDKDDVKNENNSEEKNNKPAVKSIISEEIKIGSNNRLISSYPPDPSQPSHASRNQTNISEKVEQFRTTVTSTGTIFYRCPKCKVQNIHSEEIERHLKLVHNVNENY